MVDNCINILVNVFGRCVEFLMTENIGLPFPIGGFFLGLFLLGIAIDVFVIRV